MLLYKSKLKKKNENIYIESEVYVTELIYFIFHIFYKDIKEDQKIDKQIDKLKRQVYQIKTLAVLHEYLISNVYINDLYIKSDFYKICFISRIRSYYILKEVRKRFRELEITILLEYYFIYIDLNEVLDNIELQNNLNIYQAEELFNKIHELKLNLIDFAQNSKKLSCFIKKVTEAEKKLDKLFNLDK